MKKIIRLLVVLVVFSTQVQSQENIKEPSAETHQAALIAMEEHFDANPMRKYLKQVVAFSLQEEQSLASDASSNAERKRTSDQLRTAYLDTALHALKVLCKIEDLFNDLDAKQNCLLQSRDVLNKLQGISATEK